MVEIELSTLDLRYAGHRMRDRAGEARLLALLAERGIEEPLEGVEVDGVHVLLNGFKRYRCACKLGMDAAPYTSLGQAAAGGIMALLRASNNKALSIMEQAAFIGELKHSHNMSVADIAEALSRSKSWVSMRLGLMSEMSNAVRKKLLTGAFPVYPYMYTLRQFMRMNGVKKGEIEQFVVAVSGKGLSVRDIEQLAHGYFRGPDSFAEQIRNGNVALPLEQMRQIPPSADGCSEFERVMLKDLELAGKYMQRVMGKSTDRRLRSRPFHAQAHLLSAGLLSRSGAFLQTMRQLHDRCGQA